MAVKAANRPMVSPHHGGLSPTSAVSAGWDRGTSPGRPRFVVRKHWLPEQRNHRAVCRTQAARTELTNLPTSIFSRLLSPDSLRAAESTSDEAAPVSPAPRFTSPMLDETCWVACETCCTLRDISLVAEPC